jgi:hypothetical protein
MMELCLKPVYVRKFRLGAQGPDVVYDFPCIFCLSAPSFSNLLIRVSLFLILPLTNDF